MTRPDPNRFDDERSRVRPRLMHYPDRLPTPDGALTWTEKVVLRRRADGQRNVDIAKALGIRANSVSAHFTRVKRRFNVNDVEALLALPEIKTLLQEEE